MIARVDDLFTMVGDIFTYCLFEIDFFDQYVTAMII